jgi:toxin YoeB
MKLLWLSDAWDDYLYWQQADKKTLKKINELIKDIKRAPFDGIGSPEPLKHQLSGWWSRRINLEDRLVYRVDDEQIVILQCRKHY